MPITRIKCPLCKSHITASSFHNRGCCRKCDKNKEAMGKSIGTISVIKKKSWRKTDEQESKKIVDIFAGLTVEQLESICKPGPVINVSDLDKQTPDCKDKLYNDNNLVFMQKYNMYGPNYIPVRYKSFNYNARILTVNEIIRTMCICTMIEEESFTDETMENVYSMLWYYQEAWTTALIKDVIKKLMKERHAPIQVLGGNRIGISFGPLGHAILLNPSD
jgi:hypothetical protein